jgi:hypothetical protein
VLLSMIVGLRQMLVGYWLVMVFAFFLIGIVIQHVTGGVHNSMWDYGAQSPKYFSMAIGITVTPAYFALLVSHGVTRRMFSVAAGIYLTGAAAATSALGVLVYGVEHALYSWQGWPGNLTNPHLVHQHLTGRAGVHRVLPADPVARGGRLVARITFFRFGFWCGVLLLPLALLPAATAEFLLIAQWLAAVLNNAGYQRPPLAVAVPAVLVVSALGLYAGYRVLRPMAMKPGKG